MENLYKKLPQMNEILNRYDENPVIVKDIANSVEALQLWLDKMIASGDMEKNLEPL